MRRLTKAQKRKIRSTVECRGGVFSVRWRRSLVVLMSSHGRSAEEIADGLGSDPDWVRDVIHAFNRDRMDSLSPRWAGGRPPTITLEMLTRITEIAKTRPQPLKDSFTRWSLTKLRDYLIRTKVMPGDLSIGRSPKRCYILDEQVCSLFGAPEETGAQLGKESVKLPSVEHEDRGDVDAALALLGQHGEDAKVLAGGQNFVPLLNFRMARPARLIDVGWIHSLFYIDVDSSYGSLHPWGPSARQSLRHVKRGRELAKATE